jgi:protein arginine N-methyltransferase 1
MSASKYSLVGYGNMIADRLRIEAFAQGLRRAVRPGMVVMDIGTGPGIMAILACQLGASRVYAIESSEVIAVAREIAVANRCADKIEFFEDLSTKITIPVPADVIISDLRGVLPLFGQHIPSIADARRRFLAPGGTLIARKDLLWAAVVEAPKVYGKIVDAWDHNMLGQDLGVARRKVLHDYYKERVTPEQLLTVPQLWATLDYATIENPDIHGTLHWNAERNGSGHGILVWFDMESCDGVDFSTGPASPETVYGSAFFPWLEPVPLAAGQKICVDLEAKLLEMEYFWRWRTQISSVERPGEIATRFEQSQLQGMILSPAKLHKVGSDYVPRLSEEGIVHRRAFEMIDGKASLEEIARQLTTEFPQRFNDWHKALSYLGPLSQDYSR